MARYLYMGKVMSFYHFSNMGGPMISFRTPFHLRYPVMQALSLRYRHLLHLYQQCSSSLVVVDRLCMTATMDNRCATRVGTGCAMGGALGASIGLYRSYACSSDLVPSCHYLACTYAGAAYGTFEAFRYKVLLSLRIAARSFEQIHQVDADFAGARHIQNSIHWANDIEQCSCKCTFSPVCSL